MKVCQFCKEKAVSKDEAINPIHRRESRRAVPRFASEAVDETFSASASPALISTKEPTHKSAQAAVGRQPGPRRTEGTERLVDTVDARTYTPPPCPACGEPAKATDIRHGGSGQVTGSYVCPAGHPWITKWAVVA